MLYLKSLAVIAALVSNADVALGQSPVWGQCGGMGWTGAKTCASGSSCVFSNPYYSQCIPGNNNPGTPTTTAVVTTSQPSSPGNGGGGGGGGTGTGSAGCGKSPTFSSGARSINVNGQNRQYTIRIPNGYNMNTKYKLIFGFHWVGGTMKDVSSGGTDGATWAYYGQQRASNEGAILVAPQGIGNGWGNGGGADITFVTQMRQAIENDLCVDQGARFAVGFSYGASMSFSVACSLAKDFRAVAVISGGQLSGCAGGNDPIAYLGIHGISDGTLGIAGGRSLRDRFVRNNGCTPMSPAEPAKGSKTHIKTQYTGCRAGYPVTWIAFDGGHYPGPNDGSYVDSGKNSYTGPEIWSFFNQF